MSGALVRQYTQWMKSAGTNSVKKTAATPRCRQPAPSSEGIISTAKTDFLKQMMKIRVLLPDGSLREIQGSIQASEVIANLMAQQTTPAAEVPNLNSNPSNIMANPNHPIRWLVCQSTSLRLGRRPCPLSPCARLQPGALYFVLPIRVFQSRLAGSHLSILVAAAASALVLQKPPQPAARIPNTRNCRLSRYCANFSCNSLHSIDILSNICPKAYARYVDQLIHRSNSWSPSLDSIDELVVS